MAASPNTCDCSTTSADGIVGLVLKFRKQEIIEILGVVSNGEVVPIVITGKLLDETPIESTDCVVIKGIQIEIGNTENDDQSLRPF